MKQRKPMNRGTGFKRPSVEQVRSFENSKYRNFLAGRAPGGIKAACGLPLDEAPIDHHPLAALKPLRRGTYASPDVRIRTSPKPEAHRNPHLLAMARGKPCLFRLPGICNFNTETTVAAHSNWAEHGGKGMSRKASDQFSAWSCSACHSWLDQGGADRDSKQMAFLNAHLAQVCEWRAIAGSAAADPKDIAAARWALAHLNASPVGEIP